MNKFIDILKLIIKGLNPYKKHLILISCIIVVAFIVIPNATATLDVFIENKFKLPGGYSFFNESHYTNMFKDSLNKVLFVGVAFLSVLILFDGLTKSVSKNKGKYEQVESHGSHGTASFQSNDEIKKNYFRNKKGWFIAGLKDKLRYSIGMDGVYHPVDHQELNMQMIVIGPPGSKKTTGFVLPNIFNICYQYKDEKARPDMIISDPKSEIFILTSAYLESNGYDVHVLDFINLTYGDSINPVEYIRDDKTLREISKDFINAMSETAVAGEMVFWNNQEYQLLAALTGFVIQKHEKDKTYKNTFEQVAAILKSENVCDVKKSKRFFDENEIKGAALELWNSFLMFSGSDKTRASIMGGLAEKMNLFALDGIKKMTRKTTLRLEELGVVKERPKAIFILMPDGRDTFSPLINMFISSMFNQLYETAYKNNNTLQVPVYAILDEFCNIGRIPNINQRLGTFRSRKIYPMLIMQSLAQLRDLYDSWESILSQCDTKVFLGINDDFTANECSKALGQTTIKSMNSSSDKNGGLLAFESIRDSEGFQARSLMLPDECRRLNNKYMLVVQRSYNPMKLYKVQYEYWNERFCKDTYVSEIKRFPTINLEKKPKNIYKDSLEVKKPQEKFKEETTKEQEKGSKFDEYVR
jgi:type IV secretion system protein VirD4